MDYDPATLFLGIVFSGIGFVAYRFGRRMELIPPVVLGIALMIFPWFVDRALWIFIIGSALTLLLWVFRE